MSELSAAKDVSRTAIQASMKVETIVPFGEETQAFMILRPKPWMEKTIEGAELSPAQLAPLAVYEDADGGGSVQVQAIALTQDIAAGNLLKLMIADAGWSMREHQSTSLVQAHASVDFLMAGQPFWARVGLYIRGNLAILIQCLCPFDNVSALAAPFDVVARSFDPRHKIPPGVESWAEHSLSLEGDGRAFSFSNPESWSPRLVESADAVAVDLLRGTLEAPLGLLRMLLLPGGKPSDTLWKGALGEIGDRDIALGEQRIDKTLSGAPLFSTVMLRAWEAKTDQGAEMEVWISIAESDNAALICSLISPARQAYFLEWAVNHRTFQIVNETVKQNG